MICGTFYLLSSLSLAVVLAQDPKIIAFPDRTTRKHKDANLLCTVGGLPDNPKDIVNKIEIAQLLNNEDYYAITKFGDIDLEFPPTVPPSVGGETVYKYSASENKLPDGNIEYGLKIKKVTTEDQGEYQCRIYLTSAPLIPIIVKAKLTVLDSNFQNVTAGQHVQLLCEIALRENVTVVWYKDDQVIAPGANQRFVFMRDHLEVKKTEVSDTGLYTCSTFFNFTNVDNMSTELVVQDRPSTPIQLIATAIGSTSVDLKWQPSLANNNPIFNYTVQIRPILEFWDDKYETNGDTPTLTARDLLPFTDYESRVWATNGVGRSEYSNVLPFKTKEDKPNPPAILDVSGHTDSSVNISWERPNPANGILLRYTVYIEERDGNRQEHALGLNRDDEKRGTVMRRISRLKPYTMYCVYVTASTQAGESKEKDCYEIRTDTAGPNAPILLNVTSNATGTLEVTWLPSTVFNKSVDLYEVQLSGQRNGEPIKINETITMSSDVLKPKTQLSHTLTNVTGNTTYEVRVRAATKSLFRESKYNYGQLSNVIDFQLTDGGTPDEEEIAEKIASLEYIAIGVGIAVALIVIVAAFLIYNRRRMNGDEDLWIDIDETSSAKFEDSEIDSTPVEKWAEHVAQLHADSNLKFAQEYEEINVAQDLTCNASLDPENKPKNRYTNILAYDKTRVQLQPLPGKQKGSDYINANYVGGYDNSRAYIATQGPLPNTIDDFWRLVWDKNSVVIVMITNLYEKGRRKCDQYWPEETGQEATYGFITVKHIEKTELAFYTIRSFSIKNKAKKRSGAERLIYQYHYTNWPDHGVPDYTLPVLSFIKKSSAKNAESSRPIIVHCSAGVGRTGTYIVIQSMIDQIAAKRTVSVYSFLKHIRTQRNYLVQTEDQYVFTHDALLEYIQNGGNTEVCECDVSMYIDHLTLEVDGRTELERQFMLATYYQPREHEYETARKPYIKQKNRSSVLIPVDNKSKVRIPMQPGVEGSDYINATYLHGYYQNEEFVITQHPMEHTIQDFWRMVWDQNSMTIVMLSHIQEEFGMYWNNKDEILDWEGGNFKVTSTDEQFPLDHAVRDFMLESKQDDYELKTRMLSTTNWPEGQPLATVFEFIKYVRTWHRENQAGPMIVIDNFGGKKAATFCALLTLLNQLEEEGTVDVYAVVKMYHLRRPRVFDSQDDLYFIYRAVESICKKPGENNLSMNSIDKSPSMQLQTFTGSSPRSSNYTISTSGHHNNAPVIKRESTI